MWGLVIVEPICFVSWVRMQTFGLCPFWMRLLADEVDMLLLAKGLFLRGVNVGVKAT